MLSSRQIMVILWPSFLIAGVASAIVFAFIDPLDVAIFGYIRPAREWLYAIGFFLFWVMAGLSSTLSIIMNPEPDATEN
jgi:hypothetical protein